MTRDPIGYEGSKWNLFCYVAGNPLLKVDPSGLGLWDWIKRCLGVGSVASTVWDAKKCRDFARTHQDLKNKCVKEFNDDPLNFMITYDDCGQISPILNPGSADHHVLCCIFRHAESSSTIDIDEFSEGLKNCAKLILGLPLKKGAIGIGIMF